MDSTKNTHNDITNQKRCVPTFMGIFDATEFLFGPLELKGWIVISCDVNPEPAG